MSLSLSRSSLRGVIPALPAVSVCPGYVPAAPSQTGPASTAPPPPLRRRDRPLPRPTRPSAAPPPTRGRDATPTSVGLTHTHCHTHTQARKHTHTHTHTHTHLLSLSLIFLLSLSPSCSLLPRAAGGPAAPGSAHPKRSPSGVGEGAGLKEERMSIRKASTNTVGSRSIPTPSSPMVSSAHNPNKAEIPDRRKEVNSTTVTVKLLF